MRRQTSIHHGRWFMIVKLMIAATALPIAAALAVPMHNDPNGFEGIPWGATFSESDTFAKVEDTGRVQTYELKSVSPALGPAKVDSMRFSTIDGQFARVMVRYSGKDTHDRIVGFLQNQFGPVDRTPGQIAGGIVKFFDWQGDDSEIILRYDVRTSQGIIFFESQLFRAKFTENPSPSN